MAPRTTIGSEQLGISIRTRRNELGLTIEEAAKRASVSEKTWSRYEAGSSIRSDKTFRVLRALNWKSFPDDKMNGTQSHKEESPFRSIDESHIAWSQQIAEVYGRDTASIFAIGSDIILDEAQDDLKSLSSRPRGTHVGELGASWLCDKLPQQYLTRYDYEFVYSLIRAVKTLRKAAEANRWPIVHSVMDELALFLIVEEGEAFFELFDLSLNQYQDECPEGLVAEICEDSDLEMFLYDEVMPIEVGFTYHFDRWNEQQFNMSDMTHRSWTNR